MTDYRCYFLRPATLYFGAPSTIETTEQIAAETDDQARLMAESMYLRRRNRIHGFEIWQGTRLVHRQAAAQQKIQSEI